MERGRIVCPRMVRGRFVRIRVFGLSPPPFFIRGSRFQLIQFKAMIPIPTRLVVLLSFSALSADGIGTFLACTSLQENSAYKADLSRWAGKDITKLPLDEREKFMHFAQSALLASSDRNYIRRGPELRINGNGNAYVWNFASHGPTRYLIYWSVVTGPVPSSERGYLFIVDGKGKVIRKSDFNTGWRLHPSTVSYKLVKWIESPVLLLEMRNGGAWTLCIGFDHERPALVKLEDELGRPIAVT